jgi:hypothetical protein
MRVNSVTGSRMDSFLHKYHIVPKQLLDITDTVHLLLLALDRDQLNVRLNDHNTGVC